jgi:NAD(P)-dependent dehydrogenase (short-subunit alcohol dehydrogenase family)
MHGKTVVITGATSGIGLIGAGRLAAMGARLVMVARDQQRGEATMAWIAAQGPGKDHRIHYADLCRLSEIRRVAAQIAETEPRIHVLINNAGGLFARREVTEDGFERTFATNHMAYFVLTHQLLDRLKASAPARIVNTASDAHAREMLDLADLHMTKGYRFRAAYGRSKLCNILFTREIAAKLAGTGVTANCLHPGFIRTGLGQRDNYFLGQLVRLAMKVRGRPVEVGADTLVYLASSPEVEGISGQYFVNRRPVSPSPEARDMEKARRLWAESARLAGIA